jgi:hypothetical protein
MPQLFSTFVVLLLDPPLGLLRSLGACQIILHEVQIGETQRRTNNLQQDFKIIKHKIENVDSHVDFT